MSSEQVINTYCSNGILILDNVLSDIECDQLANLCTNEGINYESNELSKMIEERCKEFFPKYCYIFDAELEKDIDKNIYNHDNNMHYWYYENISNNWRIFKRKIGDSLVKHYDRICFRSVDYKSIYTIIIYLNHTDGNLKFDDLEIEPIKGRAVIFNMNKCHEALENKTNERIFIKSKLMYKRNNPIENANDKEVAELYQDTILKYSKKSPEFFKMLEDGYKKSSLFERTILNLFD